MWHRSQSGGRRAHRGVGARTGVSVRSLRYYEEQGLLPAPAAPAGSGTTRTGEIDRVALIQRLYAAGLSSRTIAELLPCVHSPSEENSDAAMERMELERDRLSAHIADLIRTRDTLDELMVINRAHRESLQMAHSH